MTRLAIALVVGLLCFDPSPAAAQYGAAFDSARRDVRYGVLIGPYGRQTNAVGQTYRDQRTTVGPYGGVRTSGYRGGTFVNPDGSTVQYNSNVNAGRGPWGYGGAVRRDETMITAPGGNAYVYSSSSRGAVLAPPVSYSTTRRVRSTTTIGPFGTTTRQSVTTSRPVYPVPRAVYPYP